MRKVVYNIIIIFLSILLISCNEEVNSINKNESSLENKNYENTASLTIHISEPKVLEIEDGNIDVSYWTYKTEYISPLIEDDVIYYEYSEGNGYTVIGEEIEEVVLNNNSFVLPYLSYGLWIITVNGYTSSDELVLQGIEEIYITEPKEIVLVTDTLKGFGKVYFDIITPNVSNIISRYTTYYFGSMLFEYKRYGEDNWNSFMGFYEEEHGERLTDGTPLSDFNGTLKWTETSSWNRTGYNIRSGIYLCRLSLIDKDIISTKMFYLTVLPNSEVYISGTMSPQEDIESSINIIDNTSTISLTIVSDNEPQINQESVFSISGHEDGYFTWYVNGVYQVSSSPTLNYTPTYYGYHVITATGWDYDKSYLAERIVYLRGPNSN